MTEELAISRSKGYWGGPTQPYWHPGQNPTADLLLFRRVSCEPDLLLIRRSLEARADPGRWAFPGGFVDTDAPIGTPWEAGKESCDRAALRELEEEGGLILLPSACRRLIRIDIAGPGEDARNNRDAWTVKNVFAVVAKMSELKAKGCPEGSEAVPQPGDDADRVHWTPLSEALGMSLAFDHSRILKKACAQLGLADGISLDWAGP